MKCEYCGSYLSVYPDNGCCPNCGAVLPEPVKPEFPEPPLGIYSGTNCWLELGRDSVRIRKEKIALTGRSDYEIPYRELTGVAFQPAQGYTDGYLSVRYELNQHSPYPKDLTDAEYDATTVIVPAGATTVFTQVSNFLRQCAAAEKAQEAMLPVPMAPKGVYQGVDGTLEIWENCVCLTSQHFSMQQTRYVIPYKDLFAVAFQEPNWAEGGYIKLRTWHNRRMAFDLYAYDREMTFRFKKDPQKQLEYVYRFLWECARIANAARERSEY